MSADGTTAGTELYVEVSTQHMDSQQKMILSCNCKKYEISLQTMWSNYLLKNNQKENNRRIVYQYKAGNQALIFCKGMSPNLKLSKGPL